MTVGEDTYYYRRPPCSLLSRVQSRRLCTAPAEQCTGLINYIRFLINFTKMVAKRILFPKGQQSLTKRVKRVERLARQNKPEIKTRTATITGNLATGSILNVVATQIAEGTGADERIGDQIRVHEIEIRGLLDPDMDAYIIKLHTTSEPTTAVFTGGKGAFLLDSESNSRFTEMVHYRNIFINAGASTPIKIKKKLGNVLSYYNGTTSTSGIRNQICFTMLNRDSVAKAYNLSIRLTYSDA